MFGRHSTWLLDFLLHTMHRLAWLTDIHLDFAEDASIDMFVSTVLEADPDSILLGGDIGAARSVLPYLRQLHDWFNRPLHVVLGNHDFYGGGIDDIRSSVDALAAELENLHYLTSLKQPIHLTEQAGLVGHDGWADAREGDYNSSLVMMNDYLLIDELARFSKLDRLAELHRLGEESAQHIRQQLALALPQFKHVFVLTHVPPFREACWYEGQISDDEWAPHFVCQAMGRAILDLAAIHPEKELTVLCGHTHSAGICKPAPNVKVITGAAEYGSPQLTQVFELERTTI